MGSSGRGQYTLSKSIVVVPWGLLTCPLDTLSVWTSMVRRHSFLFDLKTQYRTLLVVP